MNKKEIKILDDLFREHIRKRAIQRVGGCERCLTPKFDIVKDNGDIFPAWMQLQTSHFIGRTKHATRWDEENCCGLCGACHLYFTSHPAEHTEYFKKRLGDRFDLLIARSNTRQKIDVKLIELDLKNLIANLTKTQ